MKVLSFLALLSTYSIAGTIAVIDSGVDVEHKDLLNNIWTNSVEIPNNNRDEDRNGYQDDFYGWNFAENNNLVIDRKYIGTFTDRPRKFFAVQGRSFLNQATEEDKKWVAQMRKDETFMKEMQIFGNFVHGTHVAGITQKNNPDAKILTVKLIPTEVKPFGKKMAMVAGINKSQKKDFRMKLLKGALEKLAGVQVDQLEEIAYYVGQHKADVANGSFGTGFNQAKMITNVLFKVFFFRKPTDAESDEVSKHFLESLIKQGKRMADAAPNTLFVFAAGNDGLNNDEFPTSPTNIVADNVISVAATYKNEFIAKFSNYGEKMVDIAAPGMLINSQIPGDEYLEVSGTSQAAPFVANVAHEIKNQNPQLTPKQVKKILLNTVDVKGFLKGKVKTSGLVNKERAVFAARASVDMSLDLAVALAKSKVVTEPTSLRKSFFFYNQDEITPLPLLNTFKY